MNDNTNLRNRSTEPTDERYVIGLMAGTSLDGIDAACCRVSRTDDTDEYDPFGYEITAESFVTCPYDEETRRRLVALCDAKSGTVDEVCRLDIALAERFANVAEEAWTEAGLERTDVTAVASHGQTIWHIPDEEALPGTDHQSRSTLQIGDGCVIAERLGVTTVSDFRMRDVAAGGHGAPLAPLIDAVLFTDDEVSRSIQNIGGIGNCTLLPQSPDHDKIRAFDTGPGNMVIDAVVELLTDGERMYDEDGKLAAAGEPDFDFVESLLDDPYFDESPPKSTGREHFGHDYARRFIEAGRKRGLSDDDLVATSSALTAASIADAYNRFSPQYPDEVYVSGGGAYNPTLLEMLRDALDTPVYRIRELGVDANEKEALLFALLGATCIDGVPNNVPSATGADCPVVMGKISKP